MKKSLAITAMAALLFTACNKNDSVTNNVVLNNARTQTNQSLCATAQLLKEHLGQDPSLKQKMELIEQFTQQFSLNNSNARAAANKIITIPVVVNLLYKIAKENISEAQIKSQIDVLNEDFSGTNKDYSKIPAMFKQVAASDIGVRFVLDRVIRKATTKKSWSMNDDMKKKSKGGIAPTSPATTLNIWVCNLADGALGFTTAPGGKENVDGVVILNTAFGRTGTVEAPFHTGRTATHEVGHWLNLEHIWGDATCGDDKVDDTPLHNDQNLGCPTFPKKSTCKGTPVMMTMNHMDYTDDACKYMFTNGQKKRMLAVFAKGGPRASFNK